MSSSSSARPGIAHRLETSIGDARPDVLIVGGGINGVGLFRELALQGVKVLLVEKGDYCSGSSAAPSRMIHGGLRYLEYGETGLVKESLQERDSLLRNAPHYVRPIETVMPLYSWLKGLFSAVPKFLRGKGRPSQRGVAVAMIGLTVYDIYTRSSRMVPKRSFSSRSATLKEMPALDSGVVGSAIYWDGQISHPERLALELMQDGESASESAKALNHVAFEAMDGDAVEIRDVLTDERATVRAAMGAETSSIDGVKGSHLVVDDPELYKMLDGRMVYFENSDQRICIVVPWQGKVLAGSTEIPLADPDTAVCTPDETQYILESLNELFPGRSVGLDMVVATFSGVRPLLAGDRETENEKSRAHAATRVPVSGSSVPVYSMGGGKWTTFRSFAEEVTDLLLDELSVERRVSTADLAIGGGRDYPTDPEAREAWCDRIAAETSLSTERVEVLLGRYGTTAAVVARAVAEADDQALTNCPAYSAAEVEWIVEHERVRRLDDVVLRRTNLALLGYLSAPLLDELSRLVAAGLGLTEIQREASVSATAELLRQRFVITIREGHP